MNTPKLIKTKNGWLALGNGWGVEAQTQAEAIKKFEQAESQHQEIEKRPLYFEAKANGVLAK